MTPDMVFTCTYPVARDGGSLDERPLGGSAAAVIEAARCFASRGLGVRVYGPSPRESTWSGVENRRLARLEGDLSGPTSPRPAAVVLVRDARLPDLVRRARRAAPWTQDVPAREGLVREGARVDRGWERVVERMDGDLRTGGLHLR